MCGRWRGGAVRSPASRSTAACPHLRSKRATRPAGSDSTLRPCGDAPVRPLRLPSRSAMRPPVTAPPLPVPVTFCNGEVHQNGPGARRARSGCRGVRVVRRRPPPTRCSRRRQSSHRSRWAIFSDRNGKRSGCGVTEERCAEPPKSPECRPGRFPQGMRARCLSRRRVTRPQAPGGAPGRRLRRTTEGTPPPHRARERHGTTARFRCFPLTIPLQITMFPFFIRVPARRGRFGNLGPSPGERTPRHDGRAGTVPQ